MQAWKHYFRQALSAFGFEVRTTEAQGGSHPSVTGGSGAASASENNGSMRLRTDGVPEYRVGGAWKAFAVAGQTFDSGSQGIKADVIAESTNNTGVTIDGVLLKDSVVVTGAGAVGAPALALGAAGGPGFYCSAADTIGVSIAGALDVTFTANSLNILSGSDLDLADSSKAKWGDGDDVTMAWDGTDFDILPAADDSLINFGNGTLNFDLKVFGNIATSYIYWDASLDTLSANGPVRTQGLNVCPRRFELRWVAGQRGKPGINADIQNATEATRMVADPDFELLGTNATSGSSAFYVEGGIVLTTAGADGDEVILVPHLDANQSAWEQVTWGTDQETVWECDLQTAADITNCIVWAGLKLTNTEVLATDNDQVFFRYEDDVNGGKWVAVDSIGGTDTSTDTAVTVAINTRYHLKIAIDNARVARFYLNGVLVRTTSALTNATDLKPYIGVAADGAAAAKSLRLHGQAIGRNIA